MTEQRGNNNHHGGRGRGSGRGGWNGRGGRENSNRSKFGSKNTFNRRNNEENKKGLSLFKKESKDSKEFKVHLGGDNTEKVVLPTYGDDDRDETLLVLVKEFNMMIEDGDLSKNDDIGEEATRNTFTALNKKKKLKAIKETYRKFRACLKGETRENWLKLVKDQPILAANNYEVDNTYGVEFFLKIKQIW